MGMVSDPADTALSTPKVAMVAPPSPYAALDGRTLETRDFDVSIRLISMGNFHKALTISGANCVGVAAQIPGTLLNAIAPGDGVLKIGNPSGVLPVSADVDATTAPAFARASTTYRTYRRLMEGAVLVPANLMEPGT
jgi:2-methylaconitate cis-trans-isomerase PrpF